MEISEEKIDAQKIRVATVPTATRKFRKLTTDEIDKYLKKVNSGKKTPSK